MLDEYVSRLVRIGIPQSEALGICYAYHKKGELPGYVQAQEDKYRQECAAYVREVMG